MEDSDNERSDEVIASNDVDSTDEQPDAPTPDLEIQRLSDRISNLERITRNFKITGDGFSGDFQTGFSFSPPNAGTDVPEQPE